MAGWALKFSFRLALQLKVFMLTESSTSLPVLPSENPFLQMVSSKCSRSRSPRLLCRCCLKKEPSLIKRHLTNSTTRRARLLIVLSGLLCVTLRRWGPVLNLSRTQLYLQSRNASTPASKSRRMRQTTAAVVPLPSGSHGAAIQE